MIVRSFGAGLSCAALAVGAAGSLSTAGSTSTVSLTTRPWQPDAKTCRTSSIVPAAASGPPNGSSTGPGAFATTADGTPGDGDTWSRAPQPATGRSTTSFA